MRTLLGLIVAGGTLLVQAAESDAQVTYSFGGGRGGITVGPTYGGYGYGNQPGYYSQPGYAPYGGTTYYQQYTYPGSTSYSSGYQGYYGQPGYGYSRSTTTYYGAAPGAGYYNYGGYAPYGASPGVNVYPSYRGGVNVGTPYGTYRIR